MEFSIDAQKLRHALSVTHFATHPESTRYALGGVMLECKDRSVVCVATDGKHLAYCKVDEIESEDFEVIIDARSAKEMADKIGKTASGDVVFNVVHLKGKATWKQGRFPKQKEKTIEFSVVEGRFPRWRAILPEKKNRKGAITGSRQDFIDFVCPEKNYATFLCHESEIMKTSVVSPDLKYEGEATDIRLDLDKIGTWLNAVPDSDIELSLFGDESAILAECGEAKYVLMPITQG